MSLTLRLPRKKGDIRLETVPAGAKVVLDGDELKQRTPTLIPDLEPDQPHTIKLKLHGYVSTKHTVRASADKTLIYQSTLSLAPGFAGVQLSSKPSGAKLLVNDVDTGLVSPVSGYALPAGKSYRLRLALADRVPWEMSWQPKAGEVLKKDATLPKGGRLTVSTNVAARVKIAGRVQQLLPLKGKLLPVGTYDVQLYANKPLLRHNYRQSITAGGNVVRHFAFGTLKAPKRWMIALRGAGKPAPTAAVLPGKREVKLVNSRTKKTETVTVEVRAGQDHTLALPQDQGKPSGSP